MARKFQIKRGNEEDILVLAEGEPGFTTDTKEFFIGTGEENIKYTRYTEYEGHREDEEKHLTKEKTELWNRGTQVAEEVQNKMQEAIKRINESEQKIVTLEASLYSNVTANPFSVAFDGLSGVQVIKGVWNQNKQRIEC